MWVTIYTTQRRRHQVGNEEHYHTKSIALALVSMKEAGVWVKMSRGVDGGCSMAAGGTPEILFFSGCFFHQGPCVAHRK